MPGLETLLPLLLTAVARGRLTVDRLVELTHTSPRSIFGLPAQAETWVEVDPGVHHILGPGSLQTRCGWTPFEGMAVQGRVERVVLRGRTAFQGGQIRIEPGYGRVIRPARGNG